jgi:hypothetical protein
VALPALRRAALVLNLHASRADRGVGLPVFPLQSLALPKNSIHAVFRLWVLQGKTQGIIVAGPRGAHARLKPGCIYRTYQAFSVRRACAAYF